MVGAGQNFGLGIGGCAGKGAAAHHGQVGPVIAHGGGLGPVQPQRGQNLLSGGALVLGAIDGVLHAQGAQARAQRR